MPNPGVSHAESVSPADPLLGRIGRAPDMLIAGLAPGPGSIWCGMMVEVGINPIGGS